MNDNTQSFIFINDDLANALYSVISVAAERGAFKLDEYGQVANVISAFNDARKNNRATPTPPPAVIETETETKE